MRILLRLLPALLLGVAAVAWAGELQKEGFGEARGGLALRVRTATAPPGASPLFLAIEVELRAVEGKAVSLSEPFAAKLVWQTEDGKPLPDGLRVFPSRSPLLGEGAAVMPGKPLRWTVRFLRVSEDVPKKLTVRAHVAGGRPVRFGTPALTSARLALDLSRLPVPKALERKHVAAGWTRGMAFVYQLYEGLRGWRMLEVQPGGAATVYRSKVHGAPPARGGERDLPPGQFSAQLTATEQQVLSKSLLQQQVWLLDRLPKRMLIPDESSAVISLVADDAALLTRYPIAEAERASSSYPAFHKALDALMQRVVKRAQKGRR